MEIFEDIKKEIDKTQIIILAGGSAKRMGQINKPKALLEISKDFTLLDYEINLFKNCGFRDFIFLLGKYHEQIIEHLERKRYYKEINIEISIDKEEGFGKGKALKWAIMNKKIDLKKRAIISFPDDLKLDKFLPLKLLIEHSQNVSKFGIVGTVTLTNGIEFPFGVAIINEIGKIVKFIEKPLMNTLTSIGLYCFEPEIYDIIDRQIDLYSKGAIEFEDVILPLLAQEGKLKAFIVDHSIWIPINDLKAYEKAKKIFEGYLININA